MKLKENEEAKVNGIECRGYARIIVEKLNISTDEDEKNNYKRTIKGPRSFVGEILVPDKLYPAYEHSYDGIFRYNGESTIGNGKILIDSDPIKYDDMWIYKFQGTGKPKLKEELV